MSPARPAASAWRRRWPSRRVGARVVMIARGWRRPSPGSRLAFATTAGMRHTSSPMLGDREAIRKAAAYAIETYGVIDTWVTRRWTDDLPAASPKCPKPTNVKLMQTNFWGTVHGSLVAAEHMRDGGGTIINVGSVASDLAFTRQGMYVASKHAVKGLHRRAAHGAARGGCSDLGDAAQAELDRLSAAAAGPELHMDVEPMLPTADLPAGGGRLRRPKVRRKARIASLVVGGGGIPLIAFPPDASEPLRPHRAGDHLLFDCASNNRGPQSPRRSPRAAAQRRSPRGAARLRHAH